MTYSPDKIAAYAKLDEAIADLRKAFGYNDDILTEYLILTCSVEFVPPEDDPRSDDEDTRDSQGFYTKRGQSSTLSYGMLHEAIRHYNDIQTGEYDDDE